jgi:hypothetical protein
MGGGCRRNADRPWILPTCGPAVLARCAAPMPADRPGYADRLAPLSSLNPRSPLPPARELGYTGGTDDVDGTPLRQSQVHTTDLHGPPQPPRRARRGRTRSHPVPTNQPTYLPTYLPTYYARRRGPTPNMSACHLTASRRVSLCLGAATSLRAPQVPHGRRGEDERSTLPCAAPCQADQPADRQIEGATTW